MWFQWLVRLLVVAAVVAGAALLWAGARPGAVMMFGLVAAGVIGWCRASAYWPIDPADSEDEQS